MSLDEIDGELNLYAQWKFIELADFDVNVSNITKTGFTITNTNSSTYLNKYIDRVDYYLGTTDANNGTLNSTG